MVIASRFFHSSRKSASHFIRHTHTQTALVSTRRIEPIIRKSNAQPNPPARMVSSEKIIRDITGKIGLFLKVDLRLRNIEGFIHKCLDKALRSTPCHQQVYEAVIALLVQKMWPQPAASVYDRMSKTGFISSDAVDARMLVILLADTEGSADPVLGPLSAIMSKPSFTDQDFLIVLKVAEDYNVQPKHIIGLIQTFMQGKGTEYTPRREIISTWLRAALKLGDVELMRDILDTPKATLKLSMIVGAWEIANMVDDCVEKLGMRLVGVVANFAIQEDEFLRVLDVMKEVGMNEQLVARVCESFLANRDPNYRPSAEAARAAIEAFVQVDKIDEAFALLHRLGIQPGKGHVYHGPVHQSFLANLRDSRPLDHRSFAKLLSSIDAAGIPLDTSLLNIIISREVRLRHVGEAMSLFNQMKKIPHIPPDSCTFGTLFSLYRRLRPRSLKKVSAIATPTYPLRHLFNDLVQCSKRGNNPVRPDTSLLNTALRAFMRQRDYAGAIVVIKSYDLFQVSLDNKSYYCVVKLLVRRLWAEVQGCRPKEAVLWVDRFLGVGHYTDIVLNKSLVHEIIAALRKQDFDVSLPLHMPIQRRRRRPWSHLLPPTGKETYFPFPTMRMMESLEPPKPVDFVYHPVPLIRLLSRATYADAGVQPDEASQTVDELVRKAEDEMNTPQ